MGHTVTYGGPAGAVRWGYYTAASLRDWSIKDRVLTATVIEQDDTRLSQRPLSFVVARPSATKWEWAVETLQITGTSLSATVRQVE